MENLPISGSESSSIDFFYSSSVSLQISLSISNTCLIVNRGNQTTMIELFSALIGTIFGIMSSIGGALNMAEKHFDNSFEWFKHRNILGYYRNRIKRLSRVINHEKRSMSRDITNDIFNGTIYTKDLGSLDFVQLKR